MEQAILIPEVVAEIELTYKSSVKAADRICITNSRMASQVFRSFWNTDQIELLESFKILLLNCQSKALGIIDLSKGGTSMVIADTRLIFAAALKANADKIIVAHNHPSGSFKPSQADKELTKRLVSCGNLLHIHVADHLILTADHYYSFADEGLFIALFFFFN